MDLGRDLRGRIESLGRYRGGQGSIEGGEGRFDEGQLESFRLSREGI